MAPRESGVSSVESSAKKVSVRTAFLLRSSSDIAAKASSSVGVFGAAGGAGAAAGGGVGLVGSGAGGAGAGAGGGTGAAGGFLPHAPTVNAIVVIPTVAHTRKLRFIKVPPASGPRPVPLRRRIRAA